VVDCQICRADVANQEVLGVQGLSGAQELQQVGLYFSKWVQIGGDSFSRQQLLGILGSGRNIRHCQSKWTKQHEENGQEKHLEDFPDGIRSWGFEMVQLLSVGLKDLIRLVALVSVKRNL
jgi:hypothetical protein